MTKNEQVQKDIRAKAASGVAKVKADVETIGTGISEEVKREKIERIKRRIGRHKDTLNELKMQLNELQN